MLHQIEQTKRFMKFGWLKMFMVTVAVLLRVAEADLEGLEPELRWLYRNVTKD